MNPGNASQSSRTTRPGAQPKLGVSSLTDEPKISEEDREADDLLGRDDGLSDEDLHDDEETGLTSKDRRRKQKKRRRNTQLDNRIARDNITAEEKKEADQNVVRRLVVNICLILLWYLFSLSISLVSFSPFYHIVILKC